MHICKQTARYLAKKHKTNDPYELASLLNILVIFESLGEVLGYFSTYKRIPIIHINSDIGDAEQRFTCAHELGHRILHPKVNTPFLKKNTLLSVERIEREANEFGVALMLYGVDMYEGETSENICARLGIPKEMIRYF